MDLVLKNVRIAGRETEGPTNVAIRGGRIVAIGKDAPAARETRSRRRSALAGFRQAASISTSRGFSTARNS
jgi:predicted amidohydrolase